MSRIDDVDDRIDPLDPVALALSAMAAAPVTVDDERLDVLAARIRRAVDDDAEVPIVVAGTDIEAPAPSRARRRLGPLLAAAAVIVLVAVGSLAVLLAGDDEALAIDAADRVVVELPGGEPFVGAAGTELPDGTRLEVIGFVEVDGERFGPGRYRVVDGVVISVGSGDSDVPTESNSVEGQLTPATDRPATTERTPATTTERQVPSRTAPTQSTQPPAVDAPTIDERPDPSPSTTPSTPPSRPPATDVTRPQVPAPTRPPTTPATRPTTTVPARTTTTTSAPARTTTATTAATTVPARTTVPERRGGDDDEAGRDG